MPDEFNNVDTSNINFKWLDNIYGQLKNIQDMENLAKDGCSSLAEYLQIPMEMQRVVIPDAQYKNLRFIVLEMNSLIINLSPVLKDKTEEYRNKLKPILINIDHRELFLKNIKSNNQVMCIEVLPLFNMTVSYLSEIKLQLIQEIGHILYLPNEDKKKSW
jgi:hypothetical protein